ncbi:D-alanyl-D-alanine carboxypeptidase family protein [Microbacterium sp. zg.Y909]|uniref:D-alanyl-D-alanine carboxypeptidase family protein n=1 Tax=Microbacterium sp. zg.Y909 TaxID=2969413 RepID=UPI00214D06A1|nr:D-alanyl-D-alanine carboxypeptidase [Microbacterium sp. zg.Y909]MCR2826513.1 D-alanyl-D-alanine carboxypeptidase [Microbacterium sp. zg.Y909]
MTTEDAPPLTRRARRARLRAAASTDAAASASPDAAAPDPAEDSAPPAPADPAAPSAAASSDTGAEPTSGGRHEDAAVTAHGATDVAPEREPARPVIDRDGSGHDDAAPLAPARPVPASAIIAASALPTPPAGPIDPTDEETATATGEASTSPAPAEAPVPSASHRRVALAWVDEDVVAAASPAMSLGTAASPYTTVQTDLLASRPRRSPWRPSVLVPLFSVVAVITLYVLTTLLWPLHALPPQVSAATIAPLSAPAAAPAWPEDGSAAVGVDGITGTVASSPDVRSIASLTKVVTSLMILDEMPLAPGEQGPEYRFTYADQSEYWAYRERGESALPVPVDGTLTQYQMLQGILIASANNYADRLASELWPSNRVFADAAQSWLAQQGLTGITVVDPSGIGDDNAADPAALIALAERALANPVIAEIVRMPSAELPGAGLIENTNALLADPGVVGVKTGALWQHFNLLVAKDIVVGETPVRLFASILAQFDGEERNVAARELLAQLESELQQRPAVTAGTIAGVVTTAWGERVDIVTAADASVVLWNGATGEVTTDLAVGDDREAKASAGTLTVTGPLDTATVDVRLADAIEGPSAWWRLTHPLQLFGLAG